ncbi:MAG: Benzoylformate decarboxylase, partial [Planctomycetota bacterium]
LPIDIQQERAADLDLSPIAIPDTRVRPAVDAVRKAASLLRAARNPVILAGSRITEFNATSSLIAVAELLGAPVISESGTTHGRLAFPSDHDLNAQGLPLWSPEIRERLAEYDVALVVGMDLLRQYVYHEPARAIPEQLRLVHIDEDPRQLGKNYPVEVGVIGHSHVALEELHAELHATMTTEERQKATARRNTLGEMHRRNRDNLWQRVRTERTQRPITPLALMGTVAKTLPDNIAVVEEAVTTTNTTLERLGALKNTTGYFGHRGWALGWGLGVAIGVRLAWPERPVLAILGDGATLYGVQGLWTAARHQIPVVFLVCNNAQYQILKIGARGLGLPQAMQDRFEGLDLDRPHVDLVGLARSLGVEAHRVTELDELSDRLTNGWNRDKPLVLEVPITHAIPKRLNYG